SESERPMNKNTIWYAVAAALVLLGGVALFLSWRANHKPPAEPPVTEATSLSVTGIANPVLVPSGLSVTPVLPLDASDKLLHDSMADLFGAKTVDELFWPDMLVRYIVVTVDNLPRKHLAVELRSNKNLPGKFAVSGNEQSATIDP